MKIMFMANAPWCGTGYGVQGRHLVPRLQAQGHKMAYFAFYGLRGGVLKVGADVPIFPTAVDPWGVDILEAHMEAFEADVLITLLDVWVSDHFGRAAQRQSWDWLPWFPIDQVPAPELVLERLEGCTKAVVYSHFAEREMATTKFANMVRYVPHGVDREIFKMGDQATARKRLGLDPDRFIVGMVAANHGYPDRKAFAPQFLAFDELRKKHPEAFLYLHTTMTTGKGGLDLNRLAARCGIPKDSYGYCDQYEYAVGQPAAMVADTYRAIDLLTLTSLGEGFGLPIIEAQACGTPVVVGDWTSMPELMVNGRAVKKFTPFFTPLFSWVFIPDIQEIKESYESLYDTKHSYPRMWTTEAERGSAAMAAYDWDVIAKQWGDVLEEVEIERGERIRD